MTRIASNEVSIVEAQRAGDPDLYAPRQLISAIVCTHNRAMLLGMALASLAEQTLAESAYEVIIVDNASNDETQVVAQSWVAKCPNFRYVYEPRLGLSHARNRGADEARASVVAYLDDDAQASPDWLYRLWQGFSAEPRPAAVGGPTYLLWEGGKAPGWMSRHLMHALSYLNGGDTPRLIEHINGCNMSLDKEYIQAYGGFKTHLGRRGQSLLGGEESDLMLWLRNQGAPIRYEPHAAVEHFVPKRRQTVGYFVRVYHGLGLTESLRHGRQHQLYRMERGVIAMPKRMYRAIRTSQPMTIGGALVICLCEIALLVGIIQGQLNGK